MKDDGYLYLSKQLYYPLAGLMLLLVNCVGIFLYRTGSQLDAQDYSLSTILILGSPHLVCIVCYKFSGPVLRIKKTYFKFLPS